MGEHFNRQSRSRAQSALVLVLAISLIAFPANQASANLAQILAGISSMGGMVAPAATAGASSIANGNSNVSQGQSTMNQAQMAMGMMQIAMGLLGLLAAAAAAAKADKGKNNENKLGSTSDYNPNSYKSTIQPGSSGSNSGTNTAGSSNLDSGTSDLGITPDDLRKGELGQSMNVLEKNFGISRDEFLNSLKSGADPKDIMARAPKNTPSSDTLNRIAAGLAANAAAPSGEEAARALASLGSGSLVNPGGGVAQGPLAESKENAEDLAKAAAARLKIPNTSPEEDEDAINKMSVSPEIKAALLAKAAKLKAERDMRDSSTWSIFQLVHSRYRKLETMLYGRVERTNIPSPNDATKGF